MDGYNSIGAAIKVLREQKGMSQEELGQRVGKTRQTIIKIEDDPNDAITVSLLRKIADVLGVTILDFLFEYQGDNRHIHLNASYDSIVKSLWMLFGKSDKYYKQLPDSDKELTRILGLVAMEYIKQQQKDNELSLTRLMGNLDEVHTLNQD